MDGDANKGSLFQCPFFYFFFSVLNKAFFGFAHFLCGFFFEILEIFGN